MKAHRTDIVSFAFGLIFVGIAAWWLLAQLLGLALPPVGWFLAGAPTRGEFCEKTCATRHPGERARRRGRGGGRGW
ncbi:hypothetical protein ACWENR_29375, partial [Micromonospora sp. NPDC004336]